MDPKSVAFPAKESISLINVVTGGKLYRNVPCMITFMEQESDLALITEQNPGDFAATFGTTKIWQWNGTEWKEV